MRKPAYPVDPFIMKRSSPRAMSGEAVRNDELMSLFEAARWAQSSYNNQPWRFIYGFQGTAAWDTLFSLLVPFNQSWCKNGSVLILVCSYNLFSFNKKPSVTHSFDTGAACENLALQGTAQGLVVHGMEGFDYEKARTAFAIPAEYTIEAMFVVGRPGDTALLSPELQKREVPSDRKPIAEFAKEGALP